MLVSAMNELLSGKLKNKRQAKEASTCPVWD